MKTKYMDLEIFIFFFLTFSDCKLSKSFKKMNSLHFLVKFCH